jgi:hypothetical protein
VNAVSAFVDAVSAFVDARFAFGVCGWLFAQSSDIFATSTKTEHARPHMASVELVDCTVSASACAGCAAQ